MIVVTTKHFNKPFLFFHRLNETAAYLLSSSTNCVICVRAQSELVFAANPSGSVRDGRGLAGQTSLQLVYHMTLFPKTHSQEGVLSFSIFNLQRELQHITTLALDNSTETGVHKGRDIYVVDNGSFPKCSGSNFNTRLVIRYARSPRGALWFPITDSGV